MRVDPIGLAGGINPFVYTENNPINYIDPLGLYTKGRREGDPAPICSSPRLCAMKGPKVVTAEEVFECGRVIVECAIIVALGGIVDESMELALKETAKTLAKKGLKKAAETVVKGLLPGYNIASGAAASYITYKCVIKSYRN